MRKCEVLSVTRVGSTANKNILRKMETDERYETVSAMVQVLFCCEQIFFLAAHHHGQLRKVAMATGRFDLLDTELGERILKLGSSISVTLRFIHDMIDSIM